MTLDDPKHEILQVPQWFEKEKHVKRNSSEVSQSISCFKNSYECFKKKKEVALTFDKTGMSRS